MKNIGVALRLTQTKEPKLVLDIHYGKDLLLGKVAFSTALKFDKKEISDIEKILFFFDGDMGKTYVMADVLVVESRKTPFIPEGWEEWIPHEYFEEKNSWFLIKNMRVVKEDELEEYVYSKDSSVRILDILQQSKFPRVYFKRKIKDIPSLF